MSKIFGLVLLLGLSLVVILSIGLLVFEWINSSGDTTTKLIVTPKPVSSVFYYQPALNYSLVDARLTGVS